jgi:PAS domain S-box-containing protein
MIKVLYVDDEPMMLELTKEYLESDGEILVQTHNVASQVAADLSQWPCDVIISDYQMPGMDGLEFLNAVRQRDKDIPFILFTGKGREDVVVKAIELGVDHYVQKGGEPTAQFAELAHKVRDAFEHRKAEKALKENEEKFRSLFETMNQGIVYIDARGIVLRTNPAGAQILGVVGEPNGLSLLDEKLDFRDADGSRLRPENDPVRVALHRRAPVVGATVGLVQMGTRLRRWVEMGCVPRELPDGSLQVYVTLLDITDRLKARSSEARFKALFDNMNEGVAYHKMLYDGLGNPDDYRIIDVNPSYERIIGVNKNSLLGRTAKEVYEVDKPPFIDVYSKVSASGEPQHFEVFYPHSSRHFLISAISSQKGHFATMLFDITESKNQEESIKESKRMAIALFDSQKEAALLLDREGKILTANKAAHDRYGTPGQTLVGRNLKSILPAEMCFAVMKSMEQAIANGKRLQIKTESKGRNYELYLSPIRGKGGESLLAMTIYDATESKVAVSLVKMGLERIEKALLSAQETLWEMDLQTWRRLIVSKPGSGPWPSGELSESWSRMVHPDDLSSFKRDIETGLDSNDVFESVYRIRDEGGEYIKIRDRGGVLSRDAAGRPLRLAGSLSRFDPLAAPAVEGLGLLLFDQDGKMVFASSGIESTLAGVQGDGSIMDLGSIRNHMGGKGRAPITSAKTVVEQVGGDTAELLATRGGEDAGVTLLAFPIGSVSKVSFAIVAAKRSKVDK